MEHAYPHVGWGIWAIFVAGAIGYWFGHSHEP